MSGNQLVAGIPFLESSSRVTWRELIVRGLRVVVATLILSMLLFRALTGAPATNHFSFLANAFVHGTFSVGTLPDNYADTIKVGDETFLPMGPAPAMLLMPFVAVFGVAVDEYWLALLITFLNFWALVQVLRRIGILDSSRIKWLLALFFFGTIYLAALVLGRSWFLAHLCATLFLFLAINETLRKGSTLLIGLLLGMAFLTRAPTVFSLPFFLVLILTGQTCSLRRSLRRALPLVLGLSISFVFFFFYNYSRFGSLLDTGYSMALPGAPVLREALNYGLFSLVHVPKNVYMLLLSAPQPVPAFDSPVLTFPWVLPSRWGMGILFTTPAFIYAGLAARSQKVVKAAWLAILAILPFLLTYYGVGYDQFGYRYAMDLYPFLFILTALGLETRFDRTAKVWIVISILINIWGAWCTLLGVYAG